MESQNNGIMEELAVGQAVKVISQNTRLIAMKGGQDK